MAANQNVTNQSAVNSSIVTQSATPFNTALGSGVLQSNTTGLENVAIGISALQSNTTGIQNTAVGAVALQANNSGSNNTAIGFQALELNTTGGNNAAIGYRALASNTTASQNTSIGFASLAAATTAVSNTACGYGTLALVTTGGSNTCIGYEAGIGYTASETNNICIGAAVSGTIGESNVIRIGTSTNTNTYIATPIATVPPSSSTATTAFGTSITAGTAKQNTLGYNILVNISVDVASATTATIVLGVGPTSTPATNTVVSSFSTVTALPSISFSAIVPNSYYLLVNTTGTIIITSITVQSCPM